jgi:hypothetical protein
MDKKSTNLEIGTSGMEETVHDSPQGLDGHADHDLRKLIAKATALLESRLAARRRLAIADIQRLARENGLTVSVGQPARKRGRPRKDNTATLSEGE